MPPPEPQGNRGGLPLLAKPRHHREDAGIADHSSVYRHAHAVGLFERRNQTLRLALGPIIERAMTVRVTADAVIRAAIVCVNLNSGIQPVTATSPRIKRLIAKVGE